MLEDTENNSVYEVSELINSTFKYVPNVGYDSATAFFWYTKNVFVAGDKPEPSVVIVFSLCDTMLPTKVKFPFMMEYNLSPSLIILPILKLKDITFEATDATLPTPWVDIIDKLLSFAFLRIYAYHTPSFKSYHDDSIIPLPWSDVIIDCQGLVALSASVLNDLDWVGSWLNMVVILDGDTTP